VYGYGFLFRSEDFGLRVEGFGSWTFGCLGLRVSVLGLSGPGFWV
jgi:hypothetical protein